MRLSRALHLVTAVVAWVALAVQFRLLAGTLMADGATLGFAAWRFLGFFTILTNAMIAAGSTILAISPSTGLLGARGKLSLTTAIALVGLVYSIALRSIWNPQGLQAVVDHALHRCHAAAVRRSPSPTSAMPCSLRSDGWYAYYFLDPGKLTTGQFVLNIAGLLTVVIAIALALILLDRVVGALQRSSDVRGLR